jgi:hypothetical protein
MILDSVDPGVDLRIPTAHRKAIRTTWPRIYQHFNRPLSKRLNLVDEKCPQKVHARQPLLL